MKFEDINPYASGTLHAATNEEPAIHSILIRNLKKIKKIGSIASGGEIPLLCFLTRNRKVVAIDHSYLSLGAFFSKVALIKKYGAKTIQDKFTEARHGEDVQLLFDEISNKIPEPCRAFKVSDHYSSFTDMRREFIYASICQINRAMRNINNLTLVHGDLTLDLEKYGPFDLLYISNAFQHAGREGSPTPNKIKPLVKIGGYVLATSYQTNAMTNCPEWKLRRSIYGSRTNWYHELYQRVAETPHRRLVRKKFVLPTAEATVTTADWRLYSSGSITF